MCTQSVAKYSLRILRNTLRGMVHVCTHHWHAFKTTSPRVFLNVLYVTYTQARIYPTETRGFSPSVWSEGKWPHWRVWGRHEELDTANGVQVKWHFPSAEEQRAIRTTVQEELEAPLKVLRDVPTTDTPDSAAAPNTLNADDKGKEATNALALVLAVVRSCEAWLGDPAGPEVHGRESRSDVGVQLRKARISAPGPCLTVGDAPLRSYLLEVCHALHGHYRTTSDSQSNVKMVCKLVGLSEYLIVGYSILEGKLNLRAQIERWEAMFQKNFGTSKKTSVRPMLVRKAHTLLMRRQLMLG